MGEIIASVFGYAFATVAVLAVALTLALWAAWLAARRWGPARFRASESRFPLRTVVTTLIVCSLPAGCALACWPKPQPDSIRVVQVLEVPIRTSTDRTDLISIFRSVGDAEGLVFKDATESWRNAPPEVRKTLYLALDRPVGKRREWEITATDEGAGSDPWITFFAGVDPARATRVRAHLLTEIRARFPKALSVPVLPSGALPFRRDLEVIDGAYRVREDSAATYGLVPSPQDTK